MTKYAEKVYWCENISTHTLTWSVTLKARVLNTSALDFNSHAHVERDLLLIFLLIEWKNFNSHAHVERDVDGCKVTTEYDDFNSHAHVERDT